VKRALAWGLLVVATSAGASDFFQPSLVASMTRNAVAYQGPFVEGLVPLVEHESELALLAKGEVFGTEFKLRAERLESTDDTRANRSRSALRLMELSKSFSLGEQGILTLGKTTLDWDVGFMTQPVGFFQRKKNLLDISDVQGRIEGIPLMAAGWIGPTLSITGVYSPRSGSGLQVMPEQWALNAGLNIRQLSMAAILRRARGSETGIGATFAWTASEHTVLHGSLFATRSGGAMSSAHASGADQGGEQRSGDSRGVLSRSLLGLAYSLSENNTLLTEISYDGSSLDKSEWHQYRKRVAEHVANYRETQTALATDNLLRDASALSRGSVHRGQLLFQWRHQQADWSLTPMVLVNDRGGVLFSLAVGLRLAPKADVSLNVMRTGGSADSVYGCLPNKGALQATLRWQL
jgi:hypothetical protein